MMLLPFCLFGAGLGLLFRYKHLEQKSRVITLPNIRRPCIKCLSITIPSQSCSKCCETLCDACLGTFVYIRMTYIGDKVYCWFCTPKSDD